MFSKVKKKLHYWILFLIFFDDIFDTSSQQTRCEESGVEGDWLVRSEAGSKSLWVRSSRIFGYCDCGSPVSWQLLPSVHAIKQSSIDTLDCTGLDWLDTLNNISILSQGQNNFNSVQSEAPEKTMIFTQPVSWPV